ncbi:MAG: hypothetical protein E6344_18050 [Clostridium sp.]|uniref:hypothetical protein n=1 Tax=Clostridium culturomicium TaxID=1499683 RepID=UPI00290CEEBF|nr:hypothetical protein [Clostridium sp.]MDU7085600.1 hypothetical protein [Clostridium sp.]
MNFNEYQIPKEYTNKFKVTQRDLRDFKKFWNNTLKELNSINYLSKTDVDTLFKVFMDSFWSIKSRNKEKFTPSKFKNNIYK